MKEKYFEKKKKKRIVIADDLTAFYVSFKTPFTIVPIPSYISWIAVSHMKAGVVTILLLVSTWDSC